MPVRKTAADKKNQVEPPVQSSQEQQHKEDNVGPASVAATDSERSCEALITAVLRMCTECPPRGRAATGDHHSAARLLLHAAWSVHGPHTALPAPHHSLQWQWCGG